MMSHKRDCLHEQPTHHSPYQLHLQTADTVALFNPEASVPIQKCHPYTGNLNTETPGGSKNASPNCGDTTVELQHDHVPLQKKEREEAPARPSAGNAFVAPSKRGGSFAPPAARARDEVSPPQCCCLLLPLPIFPCSHLTAGVTQHPLEPVTLLDYMS